MYKNPFKCELSCDLCDASFPDRVPLQLHYKNVHEKDIDIKLIKQPKFQCCICSNSFTKSSNLSRHLRNIHKVEREYPVVKVHKCDVCKKTFVLKKTFVHHQRIEHGIQTDVEGSLLEDMNVKPAGCLLRMSCAKCPGKMFLNRSKLREHITQVHNINIVKEEKRFKTIKEFQRWKFAIEQEEGTHYNRDYIKNTQSLSKPWREYYTCHRSGYWKTKSKGKRKSNTLKIGFTCPASFTLTGQNDSEEVTVLIYRTHLGHDRDPLVNRDTFKRWQKKYDQLDQRRKVLIDTVGNEIVESRRRKFKNPENKQKPKQLKKPTDEEPAQEETGEKVEQKVIPRRKRTKLSEKNTENLPEVKINRKRSKKTAVNDNLVEDFESDFDNTSIFELEEQVQPIVQVNNEKLPQLEEFQPIVEINNEIVSTEMQSDDTRATTKPIKNFNKVIYTFHSTDLQASVSNEAKQELLDQMNLLTSLINSKRLSLAEYNCVKNKLHDSILTLQACKSAL